ncbi:hypothetical protein EAE96_010829 [Botrytis aclada]|nr:hypothetical protein EAE96_010829 [Botrytis aclada]
MPNASQPRRFASRSLSLSHRQLRTFPSPPTRSNFLPSPSAPLPPHPHPHPSPLHQRLNALQSLRQQQRLNNTRNENLDLLIDEIAYRVEEAEAGLLVLRMMEAEAERMRVFIEKNKEKVRELEDQVKGEKEKKEKNRRFSDNLLTDPFMTMTDYMINLQ